MRALSVDEQAVIAGGELEEVLVHGRRINEALYDAYAYNGPPAEYVGNDSDGQQPNQASATNVLWIILGFFIEKILGAFGNELVSQANEREKTGILNPKDVEFIDGKPHTSTIQDGFGKPVTVVHAKNGTFWLDLDRDGKFESNFQHVAGTLYVNNANNGSFWVPCHRSDWLRCGD
jgi:hypothetical protein